MAKIPPAFCGGLIEAMNAQLMQNIILPNPPRVLRGPH